MASYSDVIFKTKGSKNNLFVNLTEEEFSLVPQVLCATAFSIPSTSLNYWAELLSNRLERKIIYVDKSSFCTVNRINLVSKMVDVSILTKPISSNSNLVNKKHKVFNDIVSEYDKMMPNYDVGESLAQMVKYIDTYKNKLSEIDLKISDIYHSIEFGHQDAVSMVKEVKALQALLRQRRNAKDCVTIIESIKTHGIDELSSVAAKISDRHYNPRYYDDIFNEENTK